MYDNRIVESFTWRVILETSIGGRKTSSFFHETLVEIFAADEGKKAEKVKSFLCSEQKPCSCKHTQWATRKTNIRLLFLVVTDFQLFIVKKSTLDSRANFEFVTLSIIRHNGNIPMACVATVMMFSHKYVPQPL